MYDYTKPGVPVLFTPSEDIYTSVPLDEVQHFFLLPLGFSISATIVTPSATLACPQHTTDIPSGTGFQVPELHDHLSPMRQSHGERGMLLLQRSRWVIDEFGCIMYQRRIGRNSHDRRMRVLSTSSAPHHLLNQCAVHTYLL